MTLTRTRRRAGLGLTEVLISIFIVAIGLIALLTLFPAGALQMAQAIQDDRAAYLAANGDVQARLFWKMIWLRDDGTLRPYGDPTMPMADPDAAMAQTPSVPFPALMQALDNPDPTLTTMFPPITDTRLASYPVFIDPHGVLAYTTTGSTRGAQWVGGQPPNAAPVVTPYAPTSTEPRIPRRTVHIVESPPPATPPPGYSPLKLSLTSIPNNIRYCTLLDDIHFLEGGAAAATATDEIQREGRFSYSWLIQRLPNSKTDQVNLNVVVYMNRSPDLPGNEYTFPASFSQGSTTMTVDATANGGELPLKKGGWVLDSSRTLNRPGSVQHAYFYRVVGIEQNPGNPNVYDLELQTPTLAGANAANGGQVYILENVIDVFQRDIIEPFSDPRPDRIQN